MMVELLSCLLWVLSAVSASAPSPAGHPADFGRQWVRSHPFTISALVQRSEVAIDQRFVDAGLNTMMIWKDRPPLYAWAAEQHIPWHLHVNKREKQLTGELKSRIDSTLQAHPGCEAALVWDEPNRSEMPAAAEVVEWLKQAHPNLLVYSNAYPGSVGSLAKHYGGKWLASGVYDEPPVPYSYDDYLNDLVQIVKPDVLMMDQYPFVQPPEGDPDVYYQNRYFMNMSAVRKAGLQAGLPYWAFIQAYETEGGGGRRFPSESDIRMQVYSCLAYGVTGIGYFTYDATFKRGMLEADGSTNRLYGDITALNAEVTNLGRVLRFLSSTDVRYVRGMHNDNGAMVNNPVPVGLGIFHPNSRVAALVHEISIHEQSARHNAMIGFFKDDEQNDYFMLVNLTHGKEMTAEQGKITLTLRLDPSVSSLTRLSGKNDQPENAPIQNGAVELTLPGGTGELFKIGNGSFPGIDR
jgi:hypothetical protein